MPQTITLTLYTFGELPTDKAKEVAREWGRRFLNDCPPWLDEYQSVARKVRGMCADELRAMADKWDSYPLSGFCADECLRVVKDLPEDTSPEDLEKAVLDELQKLWEGEVESMNTDEYIDDFLEANQYTFMECGKRH